MGPTSSDAYETPSPDLGAGSFTTDDQGTTWIEQDDHGEHRRARWRRRTAARKIAYHLHPGRQSDDTSPLRRLKTCGLAKGAFVTIRVLAGRAHATGLFACGNIWTCPTCAARIRARRELEIEKALATHVAGGGTIGMMTLTLQHNAKMPLAYTLNALNHAWRRLQQRRQFQPLYMALTGTITTLEITTGSGNNGWHPHLHVLLLAGPDSSYADIKEATEHLREAWSNLVNKRTTVYSLERGLNLVWFGHQSSIAARYVTKLAKEITLNDTKTGNDPFSLLDNSDSPEVDKLRRDLFIEYAYATAGRRAHRWSRGLRAALAMDPEVSDEELAQQNDELGTEALVLDARYWKSITELERLAWLEYCESLELFQHYFSTA